MDPWPKQLTRPGRRRDGAGHRSPGRTGLCLRLAARADPRAAGGLVVGVPHRAGLSARLVHVGQPCVPDTSQACWHAYLAGPYVRDRSLHTEAAGASAPLQLCHITAREVPQDHRACVYEAHGVAERVSIVEAEGPECLFAVNFYRHQHQRPYSDAQLGDFEAWSPALLALVRKHLQVSPPAPTP